MAKRTFIGLAAMVLFFALTATSIASSIRNDATGGDCTQIGIWDAASKTCTLTRDLYQASLSTCFIYYGWIVVPVPCAIRIDSDGITLDGNGHQIMGSGYGSYGVVLSRRTGITVKNLIIGWDFSNGISLFYSNDNHIVHNTSQADAYGIYLGNSSGNSIANNDASGWRNYGIYLEDSSNNNLITDNTASERNVGIVLSGSSENILSKNITFDHTAGVILQGAHSNTIKNNTMWCYSWGWRGIVGQGSSGNKIYNNNMFSSAFFDSGSIDNVFNLDAPIGGNYWDSFNTPEEGCNDLNKDGFCDLPYYFTGGVDYLSWTKQDGWLIVPAIVDIKPDTLNKKSKSNGNAVTAYIEIPDSDLSQVDVSSITLEANNSSVSAQLSPSEIGDYDSDGIPDLMVKFDRQEVIAIIDAEGTIQVEIKGTVGSKTFEGSDEIKVIEYNRGGKADNK